MRWLQQAFVIGALLAGSLQAGELTLTATDNGDGTLTIGMDSFTDFPPVGIALMLDPNSSELKALHRGMPYYDIITTFDVGSDEITAFAALATLGEDDPFPAQVPNLITLDFGGPATGVIQEDTLRGGIVDIQGQPLTSNLPIYFTITSTLVCETCLGDLNGDGLITGADIDLLVPSFGLAIGNPGYEPCGDFNGDGLITGADIGLLVPVFGQACP